MFAFFLWNTQDIKKFGNQKVLVVIEEHWMEKRLFSTFYVAHKKRQKTKSYRYGVSWGGRKLWQFSLLANYPSTAWVQFFIHSLMTIDDVVQFNMHSWISITEAWSPGICRSGWVFRKVIGRAANGRLRRIAAVLQTTFSCSSLSEQLRPCATAAILVLFRSLKQNQKRDTGRQQTEQHSDSAG